MTGTDSDGDGRVTQSDLRIALETLVRFQPGDIPSHAILRQLDHDESQAVLRLGDGSSLTIPRAFSGRLTDVVPDGEYARRVIGVAAPFPSRSCASLAAAAQLG